uniref:VTT domain-containing protein n=1 Tax=Euplotes harpa TaxID=151035 RepID=A0A7S3J0W2_9SPIT|mmetsp:Transcript_13612/g.15791  ORF Transcript_13612/g.15791 Transcript_13612/m.15791 type:complete len:172 (+) Transcript_13612:443-958(+)
MQVGSLLAFWNGRYLFSSCVQTCIESRPKMKAISQALSFNAKKLVALMRICAITPYFILNNICAVTKMSTVDYIIGNLPIIVADVPYIWVCASISDVSKVTDSNPLGVWYYVLLAVGLMIILIVIVLIYIFAKKEFNKTMANIKKQQEEEENRENQSNSINHRSDRPIEDI